MLKQALLRKATLISCGALLVAAAALSAPVTATYEYDSAGRLISATQDGWENLAPKIPEIMDSDQYTLRFNT